MRALFLSSILPALLLVSGCATIQTARNFDGKTVDGHAKPLATITTENYGYYLFGQPCLPLIVGNPYQPNEDTWLFFEDTVVVDNNITMANNEARRLGAKQIVNIKSEVSWTGSFSLWIVWKKLVFTSAVATE